MSEWNTAQDLVDRCRLCEAETVPLLCVPAGSKAQPRLLPPVPTTLLMVAIAPPWGGGHFWDEGVPDRLRAGVYRALGEALGITLTTVAQFCADGFYLVPAVRCPSVWGGRDHLPRAGAVRNCSRHLHTSVLAIRPKRVLMLGRVPLRAMSLAFDLDLPSSVRACRGRQWTLALPHGDMTVAATYFPGNNRHRGFDAIVETLRNLMR